jgi:hypothetical protein
MKTMNNLIFSAFALFAFACFSLAPTTDAQCPQICNSSSFNTAFGINALPNDSGMSNTAVGSNALENNMGNVFFGAANTATGATALASNTTGSGNTATGAGALEFNTTANNNTAIGETALTGNTTGSNNTAIGFQALTSNTTGSNNVAEGPDALQVNGTGQDNTAIGSNALFSNTTGNNNIALGDSAGFNLSTGSNNIDIGNAGVTGESSKIRIGTKPAQKATFIAGISGVTVANGVGVIVNTQGQLGTVVSSERFKEAIKPMDMASEAILALKPVTFRYKHDLDPDGIAQFGLIAEDVEKVNPDLVARDEQGKPYTVRYEAVNAMLLNEFLKARRQIDAQEKQIEALTAGLQKVCVQLEIMKQTPQTVSR